MQQILDAILAGDTAPEEFAHLDIPESYRAALVRKDEVEMFEGMAAKEKDPRKSLHVEEVAMPELGPGEALVAVMASADQLQHRLDLDLRAGLDVRLPRALRPAVAARQAARPALPRGRLRPGRRRAADRTGRAPSGSPAPRSWRTACSVELEDPEGHDDTMLDPQQRIWGFETNFGGLAEIAMVKANQLMPKPAHLTWEEAASPGLVNSHRLPPARQQERRRHEAGRQRPDLGRFRRPRRLRHPVRAERRRDPGVRRLLAEKAEICHSMGAELVIDRSAEGYRFWKDEHTQDPTEWKRFGEKIR